MNWDYNYTITWYELRENSSLILRIVNIDKEKFYSWNVQY